MLKSATRYGKLRIQLSPGDRMMCEQKVVSFDGLEDESRRLSFEVEFVGFFRKTARVNGKFVEIREMVFRAFPEDPSSCSLDSIAESDFPRQEKSYATDDNPYGETYVTHYFKEVPA
jgi:hypothetical protein